LHDDCSEFLSGLRLQIRQEGEDFCIEVTGAVALANAIAYISELIDPVSIFLGLTRKNMTEQSMNYMLTGQGETGLMVYQILVRYWEWTAEEDVRPLIFLLSD
jgi:repressor of nif and glnA expression